MRPADRAAILGGTAIAENRVFDRQPKSQAVDGAKNERLFSP